MYSCFVLVQGQFGKINCYHAVGTLLPVWYVGTNCFVLVLGYQFANCMGLPVCTRLPGWYVVFFVPLFCVGTRLYTSSLVCGGATIASWWVSICWRSRCRLGMMVEVVGSCGCETGARVGGWY